MDDWGKNPDVALFVGGPKHCDIENIGSTKQLFLREPMDIYTFGSALPQTIYTNDCLYVRGQVSLRNGTVVTVMYDRQWKLAQVAQVTEVEWVSWKNWNMGMGGWFNGPGTVFSWTDPIPRKTPEEATAWLYDGKGKDFL